MLMVSVKHVFEYRHTRGYLSNFQPMDKYPIDLLVQQTLPYLWELKCQTSTEFNTNDAEPSLKACNENFCSLPKAIRGEIKAMMIDHFSQQHSCSMSPGVEESLLPNLHDLQGMPSKVAHDYCWVC